jgi:acyl carrier protein
MTESWGKDEILVRVTEVLVDSFEIDPAEIKLDSHVVDDLDLDSIDAIDLAVGLRERIGLDLTEEELKSIRVVQDIVDLLQAKLPGA